MTVENECEQIMDELDRFIQSNGRSTPRSSFTKAAEDHPTEYPATRAGLVQFAKASGMQQLLVSDPAAFRKSCLDFVFQHELVRRGELTPTEVAMLGHELEVLPAPSSGHALNKAATHAERMARPWDFEPSPRGLQAFLHSDEMKQLQRDRPAVWRQHHLDFYASIQPAPTPKEISVKRLELESSHPDRDPAQSTMTKSWVQGSHLSHGQSVLVSNFGPDFADPNRWMIHR